MYIYNMCIYIIYLIMENKNKIFNEYIIMFNLKKNLIEKFIKNIMFIIYYSFTYPRYLA